MSICCRNSACQKPGMVLFFSLSQLYMNLPQRPDVSPLRILEYLGLSKISGDVRHHSSARLMCYSMLSGSLLFASSL